MKKRAYMTIGTLKFLKNFIHKHPKIDFYFMNNVYERSTLVYYEGSGRSVFAAGDTYQIVLSHHEISPSGYVVMSYMPINKDERPVFEDRWNQYKNDLIKTPGLIAFRLLKRQRGQEYLILTQWRSAKDFELSDFKEEMFPTQLPAYFASRPYTTYYTMVKDENEA